MVRKTKEESTRTYHSLLDAALELFLERGAEGTTLNDIAKQVGMTRGAVYWHFQNKADIIMALWNRDVRSMQEDFLRTLEGEPGDDPSENLRSALFVALASLNESPNQRHVIRIIFNALQITEKEDALQEFMGKAGESLYDSLHKVFLAIANQGKLKNELDARIATLGLCSYLVGLLQMSDESGSKLISLETNAPQLVSVYLDSLVE